MKTKVLSVLLVLLFAIAFMPGPFRIPEYWITVLNDIGLYSIVTIGLVLLTGIAGLTSFGQAAFVGIGAYCTAYLSTVYGVSPWLGLCAGLVIATFIGFGIGAVTMRLSGHFLPLGTIAWGISLYYLFGNSEALGKFDGLTGIPGLNLFGFDLGTGRAMFVLIWLVVLGSVVAVQNLLDSRLGRAIRAVRGSSAMAESMGVNTAWIKIVTFLFAANLAAVAGFLFAHVQKAVNPTPFGINYGIEYLFMTVVGGATYVIGAVAGAASLTFLKDGLQRLLPVLFNGPVNYEMIAFGVLMILILHYTKDGLWSLVHKLFPSRARRLPLSSTGLTSADRRYSGGPVLRVNGIHREFGGLVAVNSVSFNLTAGEIVALIGPNGAGKSTTFNLISGMLAPTRGEVWFCGERIDGTLSRDIVRRGIARTFQHVRLIREMTVLENVALGSYIRGNKGVFSSVLRLNRSEEDRIFSEAAKQLQRVGLGDYMHMEAGSLALGQQRILEIARALCTDPMLLLLDEPAAGLRLNEKQALACLLKDHKKSGMTILLVEHDMDFVMNLTDRLVVMNFGTHIAEGSPGEVVQHPAVIEAYLGMEA
jgi:branched-chain amino acid transport system permease protein